MRNSLFVVAAIGLEVCCQVAVGATVRIADGDCAGLSTAASSTSSAEIILARNGTYAACAFDVGSYIVIEGEGATLGLVDALSGGARPQITVAANASLTLRNLNISNGALARLPASQSSPKILLTSPSIVNDGVLTFDSISAFNTSMSDFGFVANTGAMTVRNSSFVITYQSDQQYGFAPAQLSNSGTLDISNSTFSTRGAFHIVAGSGIRISNSVLFARGLLLGQDVTACDGAAITSLGGNVFGDSSCNATAADKIVADGGFADFGLHGGVVNTLALSPSSAAIGAGIATQCEAADARGASRGQLRCDAGAYEYGGGAGHLSEAGMSGTFYSPQGDGDYVVVERLASGQALVFWNTFDGHGNTHSLFGVGTQSGTQIHVAQVAENQGGVLQVNGLVAGSHPNAWGTFDLTYTGCSDLAFTYVSAQPGFGSATVLFSRVTSLTDVDCSP